MLDVALKRRVHKQRYRKCQRCEQMFLFRPGDQPLSTPGQPTVCTACAREMQSPAATLPTPPRVG
jgi:hypothetical protein